MLGMNASTGEAIDDIAHLRQSIQDILATPLGSRVMRRDYGSRIFELLDRPLSQVLIADIQAAVAMALTLQEPRIRLTQVEVDIDPNGNGLHEVSEGRLFINLRGYYLPDGRHITLENIDISN